MATAATFGKRTASSAVQPVRRQPRQGRASRIGAPVENHSAGIGNTRAKTIARPTNVKTGETILRIERTWFDAAIGAFFVYLGYALWPAAHEPGITGLLISGCMISGGALTMANHLLGRAKLIVDEEGFRGDGIVLAKKMKWEELSSFHIQTVNGFTIVNAKSEKLPGSKSNSYVHVPNSAFKMKSLEFVQQVISHRPDMSAATYDVMQHLGAKKLIENL